MNAQTKTSDFEVDGYAISVVVAGDRVACSAFKDKILYSASWDRATMMHCSLAAGSQAVENPLPAGLMLAFGKARILMTAEPDTSD
jgi:hypothetical protein